MGCKFSCRKKYGNQNNANDSKESLEINNDISGTNLNSKNINTIKNIKSNTKKQKLGYNNNVQIVNIVNNKNNKIESDILDIHNNQEKIKEIENLRKQYMNKISLLENTLKEIKEKNKNLEIKNKDLEKGMKEINKKCINSETKNKVLEKENKEIKIKYSNLETKSKDLEKEKIKYANLELKYKELEKENIKFVNLESKYKELEKEKIKFVNLESKYKELEKENLKYINLETKYKELEKQNKEINEKYIDLEAKSKEIIEKLRKDAEKLKKNISLYEDMKQKYSLLELENKDAKKNIFNLQNQNKDLNNRVIQLQKNNEVLQNQNKDLVDKDFLLQKNISDLKNQNKDITEKNILLKKENKKLYEENLLLKKTPILVGLNNIGATCYMNATLQCLSNTDELTNFYLKTFKYDSSDNNKIISNAYYNVVKSLWDINNNNKSFSPNEFKEKLSKENPLFAGIAANDSKDLINFLLERFHNELNVINKQNNQKDGNNISYEIKPNDQLNEQKMLNIFTSEFKAKYNSIISNLFYGVLETKSQCQQCKYIKYNFQVYSFIEFPLERVNQYCFNTGRRYNYNMNSNKNPDIDLYECFEYYNNLELMAGDNQMYCNICNCNCDSLYGSVLYSTPNYLIINLNRGRGAIYECNVNFPEQLNLFNFVTFKNGNTVYELYAVICHIGPSSMSGHFIAFCKNRIDKKWYKYNDAFVTLCENPNEYRSGMPYILFYKVLLSS